MNISFPCLSNGLIWQPETSSCKSKMGIFSYRFSPIYFASHRLSVPKFSKPYSVGTGRDEPEFGGLVGDGSCIPWISHMLWETEFLWCATCMSPHHFDQNVLNAHFQVLPPGVGSTSPHFVNSGTNPVELKEPPKSNRKPQQSQGGGRVTPPLQKNGPKQHSQEKYFLGFCHFITPKKSPAFCRRRPRLGLWAHHPYRMGHPLCPGVGCKKDSLRFLRVQPNSRKIHRRRSDNHQREPWIVCPGKRTATEGSIS